MFKFILLITILPLAGAFPTVHIPFIGVPGSTYTASASLVSSDPTATTLALACAANGAGGCNPYRQETLIYGGSTIQIASMDPESEVTRTAGCVMTANTGVCTETHSGKFGPEIGTFTYTKMATYESVVMAGEKLESAFAAHSQKETTPTVEATSTSAMSRSTITRIMQATSSPTGGIWVIGSSTMALPPAATGAAPVNDAGLTGGMFSIFWGSVWLYVIVRSPGSTLSVL